jgi:hypothetical protein
VLIGKSVQEHLPCLTSEPYRANEPTSQQANKPNLINSRNERRSLHRSRQKTRKIDTCLAGARVLGNGKSIDKSEEANTCRESVRHLRSHHTSDKQRKAISSMCDRQQLKKFSPLLMPAKADTG